MNFRNIFSVRAYKDKFLHLLSSSLRPYLAVTPLVWGDAANVTVGNNVKLSNILINCRSGKVTIGDNAFFGHSVMLLTGMHDLKKRGEARHDAVPTTGRDIHIGAGAWVASNVVVIAPCDIGENAVIGAGSVVTGTIPPETLCAGNPAKILKKI